MNQILVIGGVAVGLFALTFFVGEMRVKRRNSRNDIAHRSDPDTDRDRS
jgi:hypothetical protein